MGDFGRATAIVDRTMKLYENVVIGNFLYTLGFVLGRTMDGDNMLPVVNLLQQTPDDARLADVFIDYPLGMRIIEFKRAENADSKEQRKLTTLKNHVEPLSDFKRYSLSVHWFVETTVPSTELVSRIVPYLKAYPPGEPSIDFLTFVDRTAEALILPNHEFTKEWAGAYLDLLIQSNAEAARSEDGGTESGAVQPQSSSLIIGLKEGELAYAHVASYGQLDMKRSELYAQYQDELLLEQEVRTEISGRRAKNTPNG